MKKLNNKTIQWQISERGRNMFSQEIKLFDSQKIIRFFSKLHRRSRHILHRGNNRNNLVLCIYNTFYFNQWSSLLMDQYISYHSVSCRPKATQKTCSTELWTVGGSSSMWSVIGGWRRVQPWWLPSCTSQQEHLTPHLSVSTRHLSILCVIYDYMVVTAVTVPAGRSANC